MDNDGGDKTSSETSRCLDSGLRRAMTVVSRHEPGRGRELKDREATIGRVSEVEDHFWGSCFSVQGWWKQSAGCSNASNMETLTTERCNNNDRSITNSSTRASQSPSRHGVRSLQLQVVGKCKRGICSKPPKYCRTDVKLCDPGTARSVVGGTTRDPNPYPPIPCSDSARHRRLSGASQHVQPDPVTYLQGTYRQTNDTRTSTMILRKSATLFLILSGPVQGFPFDRLTAHSATNPGA